MDHFAREIQTSDRPLTYSERKSRFSANIPIERKRKQAPLAPLKAYGAKPGHGDHDFIDGVSSAGARRAQWESFEERGTVTDGMRGLTNPDSDGVSISDSGSCSSVPVSPKLKHKAVSGHGTGTLPKHVISKQHYLPVSLANEGEIINFSHLRNQVHRRTSKQVFEFTIMVVGESGLGKSTLLNTLFLTDLYKDREESRLHETVPRTTEIEVRQVNMMDRGVRLRLSIVDTPGFGDLINGDDCWRTIVDYVDHQMEQFFHAESGVNRKRIQDMRVHCCLYFISPYGRGLKPIDIDMMKKLHHKVNIIPIIGKADTLTGPELKKLKKQILQEITDNYIRIYNFSQSDSDEEDEFYQEDDELRSALPFAVIGCNNIVQVDGKSIRSRTYPWGIVEVDNPEHCDFVKLKKTISVHMQDLRNITSEVLYENYRAQILSSEDSFASLVSARSTQVELQLQAKEEEIRRMQAILQNIQSQMSEQSAPSVPPRANDEGTDLVV